MSLDPIVKNMQIDNDNEIKDSNKQVFGNFGIKM